MTGISLVIPTRNRPDALAACLDALVGSFPADAETIVVSDGGRLRLDLEPWFGPLRLRLIETSHSGPAAARNRGLAAATGSVVAFTDDDCRPRPGWLASLAAAVSSAPPGAAGGTTINGVPANAYADAAHVILELVGRHGRGADGEERFFSTTNVAFPADAVRELGGFDEAFTAAEDRELCRRWRDAGLLLRRVPDAVVEHHPALDLAGFVRKFYVYGRGANQFHSAPEATWRERTETLAFHLQLPRSLALYVRRRRLVGGVRLLGLVVLWEIANLVGFVAASGRRTAHRAQSLPASAEPG